MPKTHILYPKPWEAAALADGSKTSLLRLMKKQPFPDEFLNSEFFNHKCIMDMYGWANFSVDTIIKDSGFKSLDGTIGTSHFMFKAPYQPGDTLVCKETWALVPATAYVHSVGVDYRQQGNDWSVYKAGWERCAPTWRSPVTMPRWAVRTVRKVVGVQCLRVQDLNPEKCKPLAAPRKKYDDYNGLSDRASFLRFLDKDYPGAWGRNDWAWLYDLEVV